VKKVLLVLALVLAISSSSFAQLQSSAPQKTNMFGINPLGLLLNIYSGHYGKIINDGANEINVPFFFWAPTDDITIMGIGGKYRFYKDGNGQGVFYGGGLDIMSVSWDYSYWGYETGTETETVTGITFTPKGEVGYRWSWDNGWTVAPSIELGYTVGSIEASDGETVETGGAGIAWGLSIGLAYMW
jgi:hypothetical protein